MRLQLVRLFAVVIALVVPLQSMAAVTAGQCMAFGHHHSTPDHESQSDAQNDQHGHDRAAHSHSNEANNDDQSEAHCGTSASIAGPAGLSILPATTNARYVFSQFPPIGVQPIGLDRPPLAL